MLMRVWMHVYIDIFLFYCIYIYVYMCMYVCLYVCMCLYIYIDIYLYTITHTHTHIQKKHLRQRRGWCAAFPCPSTPALARPPAHIHVYVCLSMCSCTRIRHSIGMHMSTWIPRMSYITHMCMHTYIQPHDDEPAHRHITDRARTCMHPYTHPHAEAQ